MGCRTPEYQYKLVAGEAVLGITLTGPRWMLRIAPALGNVPHVAVEAA
jgi:hypothetical protein